MLRHIRGASGEFLDDAVTYLSVMFWVFVIWYSVTFGMVRAQYGVLFLGGMSVIYILNEFDEEDEAAGLLHPMLLILSLAVIVFTIVYMTVNFEDMFFVRSGYALEHEYPMAMAFIGAMTYLTWRSFGATFLAVLVGGLFYGLYGWVVPGVLGHSGLGGFRMLRLLVMEFNGFFGFLTQLIAAWIAMFLLFAGLLRGYGAFDLIFRLAIRASKHVSSGLPQTALVSSAIIGMVNGSQTANAGMTGSFTIPLMIEGGIERKTAGGIEAVASTLGQILPPVMGASAFIMASLIIGLNYVDVLVAGLIPAVILVITTGVAIHFISERQLEGHLSRDDHYEDSIPRDEMPFLAVEFGIPLLVLIASLGVFQFTVTTSALYTVISMLILGFVSPASYTIYSTREIAEVASTVRESASETIAGARHGAILLAPIVIIIAAINAVVDVLQASAMPTSLSLALIGLTGGSLLLAAIFAFGICIIMGLGMPTPAAYTIVALLITPTLISDFMVPDLAAHFFVFYAAILAGITPPVATAAAVASGISGSGFWETAFESMKIAIPFFIFPMAFIYNAEIVSGSLGPPVLFSGALALIGAIALTYGMNKEFDVTRVQSSLITMALVVTGTLAMAHPMTMVRIGACVGAVVIVGYYTYGQRESILRPAEA